jgi:hypothetical protein
MPRLLRFLALHCAIGVAAGVAFAIIMVMTNPGGLGDVIWDSEQPWLPIAMLCIGCALTFGSTSMAMAVMSLPRDPPA